MAASEGYGGQRLVYDPLDFATGVGAALGYMKRSGQWPGEPRLGPLAEPDALRPHFYPLKPPLPLAPLQMPLNGEPSPDRGQTFDWPHPVFPESLTEESAGS